MTVQQVFKATVVVLLTLAAAYALLLSARILIVLIVAILIASAIRPLIAALMHWRVPEGLAIVLVYFSLATSITVISVAIVPPLVNQVAFYLENDSWLAYRIITAQEWIENELSTMANDEVALVTPDQTREAVADLVRQVRRIIPDMVNGLGATLGEAILIFVMGAYWLTSHGKAIGFMTDLFPGPYRDKAETIINEIEVSVGSYMRGVVFISVIVGLLNFAVMHVLNVPNALTLSFLVAVTSMVPMIGGLIGAVIAGFLTVVVSPPAIPVVVLTVLIIHQFENYYLAPRIKSNRIGVDPLLIIVYTAIGFVMLGLIGALIAVPIMGALHIIFLHLVLEPHKVSIEGYQSEDDILLTTTELAFDDKL